VKHSFASFKRLYRKFIPSGVAHSTLILLPLLPRNRYTSPVYGYVSRHIPVRMCRTLVCVDRSAPRYGPAGSPCGLLPSARERRHINLQILQETQHGILGSIPMGCFRFDACFVQSPTHHLHIGCRITVSARHLSMTKPGLDRQKIYSRLQ